jgi:hypothetical protein
MESEVEIPLINFKLLEWLTQVTSHTKAQLQASAVLLFSKQRASAEKSKVQQATTLSVTEAELTSGTDYAQDK